MYLWEQNAKRFLMAVVFYQITGGIELLQFSVIDNTVSEQQTV